MKMRRVLSVVAFSAAVLPLAAQSTNTIIQREEARFAALKSGKGREQFYSRDYISVTPPGAFQAVEDAFARHDAAAYERLTLLEFVRIGDYGGIAARAEWIKNNISGNKDTRLVPLTDDVRVRVYGDVAVMTHRHIARDTAGTTPALASRMMRAWVKRDDAWKLAATITTTVSPAQ